MLIDSKKINKSAIVCIYFHYSMLYDKLKMLLPGVVIGLKWHIMYLSFA